MENNENTILEAAEQPKEEKKNQNSQGWQAVAIGGVTGILIGAGGMYAADAFAAGEEPEANTDEETATESDGQATAESQANDNGQQMADNELQVAEVDQNLSFGEAFAAARAAVGPGGVFHWHGGVYGTYYAEEWNSMTPAERAAFAQQAQPEVRTEESAHRYDTAQYQREDDTKKQEDPENHDEPENHDKEEEPEVRFLGVERVDTENGPWNVGHMVSGDQEVAFVDVDDDFVFDVRVSDSNHNGKFEGHEIQDISERNLTVTDFALASALQGPDAGEPSQPGTVAHMQQDQIGEDMPDYMNDADVQTI